MNEHFDMINDYRGAQKERDTVREEYRWRGAQTEWLFFHELRGTSP